MPLRYPNARLFLHDLLFRERLSGAQALAAGACCFELVPAQAVSEILLAPVNDDCRCLDTAAEIVEKHLALRHSAPNALIVDHKVVFAEIEKQARSNPDNSGRDTSKSDAAAGAALAGRGTTSASNALAGACHNHAPALFDIMLQQLMRYS
ncbi:MAG: hypothetical protein KGS72_22695 [Cyanobacteria bacterium REEB67]|nr:hypothetical protein [Cyanobacteria bacterium REEB67]